MSGLREFFDYYFSGDLKYKYNKCQECFRSLPEDDKQYWILEGECAKFRNLPVEEQDALGGEFNKYGDLTHEYDYTFGTRIYYNSRKSHGQCNYKIEDHNCRNCKLLTDKDLVGQFSKANKKILSRLDTELHCSFKDHLYDFSGDDDIAIIDVSDYIEILNTNPLTKKVEFKKENKYFISLINCSFFVETANNNNYFIQFITTKLEDQLLDLTTDKFFQRIKYFYNESLYDKLQSVPAKITVPKSKFIRDYKKKKKKKFINRFEIIDITQFWYKKYEIGKYLIGNVKATVKDKINGNKYQFPHDTWIIDFEYRGNITAEDIDFIHYIHKVRNSDENINYTESLKKYFTETHPNFFNFIYTYSCYLHNNNLVDEDDKIIEEFINSCKSNTIQDKFKKFLIAS